MATTTRCDTKDYMQNVFPFRIDQHIAYHNCGAEIIDISPVTYDMFVTLWCVTCVVCVVCVCSESGALNLHSNINWVNSTRNMTHDNHSGVGDEHSEDRLGITQHILSDV